jgi:hypothetical protein
LPRTAVAWPSSIRLALQELEKRVIAGAARTAALARAAEIECSGELGRLALACNDRLARLGAGRGLDLAIIVLGGGRARRGADRRLRGLALLLYTAAVGAGGGLAGWPGLAGPDHGAARVGLGRRGSGAAPGGT